MLNNLRKQSIKKLAKSKGQHQRQRWMTKSYKNRWRNNWITQDLC